MQTHEGEGFTLTSYFGAIEFGEIIKTQIPLKWYHNSILNNHQKSTLPSEFSNGLLLFLGSTLDYVIGDLILKEGEPKPFTDKFLQLE